jgi:hypothetical protein
VSKASTPRIAPIIAPMVVAEFEPPDPPEFVVDTPAPAPFEELPPPPELRVLAPLFPEGVLLPPPFPERLELPPPFPEGVEDPPPFPMGVLEPPAPLPGVVAPPFPPPEAVVTPPFPPPAAVVTPPFPPPFAVVTPPLPEGGVVGAGLGVVMGAGVVAAGVDVGGGVVVGVVVVIRTQAPAVSMYSALHSWHDPPVKLQFAQLAEQGWHVRVGVEPKGGLQPPWTQVAGPVDAHPNGPQFGSQTWQVLAAERAYPGLHAVSHLAGPLTVQLLMQFGSQV